MSDNRDKEIETLARMLCRSAGVEPSALVVEGEPLGPIALNGRQVRILNDAAFMAWRCFTDIAAAVLDAGWALPDGAEPDMTPAPELPERIER